MVKLAVECKSLEKGIRLCFFRSRGYELVHVIIRHTKVTRLFKDFNQKSPVNKDLGSQQLIKRSDLLNIEFLFKGAIYVHLFTIKNILIKQDDVVLL